MKPTLLLTALLWLPAAADTPKIIFDTDMISDFDDVGALACLHALADAGECEILATVSSTRSNASVGAIEVINTYYGRGDLPVGAPKGMGVLGAKAGAVEKVDPASPLGEPAGNDGGHYKYRKLLADYPLWFRHADADTAPDANETYRRILAAQPDGSVTVCSVGFLTNLRRLLETPPDDISPLDGKALVAKKVCKLVAMACRYPNGKEYNSKWDAESSRIVLDEWPVAIVFSDFEYGRDVFAGRAIAETPDPGPGRNPVRDVFAGNIPPREEIAKDPALWLRRSYGMGGRSAWDETAVLAAVRGETSYFNTERGRYRMTGADGNDEWAPDENGPHLRITEKLAKAEVGRIIDELILRERGRGKREENARGALVLDRTALDPDGEHVQGIAAAPDALYVAQRTRIVKTDWSARVLAMRETPVHTGDIFWHDGFLYAALAKDKKGYIQVFDADLNLVRERELDRVIDGIAILDGIVYVGMGAKTKPSQKPHRVNILGRFDAATLEEIAPRAEFDYGVETKYGFQNITTDGEKLYGTFYATGGGAQVVAFDKSLRILSTHYIRANQGLDLLPARMAGALAPVFIRANTRRDENGKIESCSFDLWAPQIR